MLFASNSEIVDLGRMTLYFSEAINPAEFDPTVLRLASEPGLGGLPAFEITGQSGSPVIVGEGGSDYRNLTFDLVKADLDGIKMDSRLAAAMAEGDVFLFHDAAGLITDMFGVEIVPIAVTESLPVGTIVADTTSPNLVRFEFDLNAGEAFQGIRS